MKARELRKLLEDLGLTQTEAARRLGISQVHMWRLYHGKSPIQGPIKAALECWRDRG